MHPTLPTAGLPTRRHSPQHRRFVRLAGVLALVVTGVIGGSLAASLGTAGAAGRSTPVPNLCTKFPHPAMPPSTGTQTPAGFTIQMPGAVLAPSTDANTLAYAYAEWNDMTCTEYSHHYQFAPPKFYYFDCVGFTGYTTSKADPTAWASVAKTLHIGPGYVPTPLAFEGFFNSLASTPQTGWQAVPDLTAVRPGDIFAWQPASSDGQPNLQGVGHSVMPLVTPQPIPGSNNTRWEVVIMDSTAGGHGPDDTRKPDDPLSERNAPILTTSGQVQPSGLGIGTIVLDTDASGTVTGVEWNVGDKPEPIVFGAGHPIDDPNPIPPGPLPVVASYDVAGTSGAVSSYGAAYNYGPTTPPSLAAPIVGLAATTDGNGYWQVSGDGGVFAYGSAPFRGSMAGKALDAPIVGIVGTQDQNGYWLVGADGGVFAFGDAGYYGSLGGNELPAPIVGIAATPDSLGYWLVGADGTISVWGDAGAFGSLFQKPLNAPIVGITPTTDGQGYWMVAADGGVFAFGDAPYLGSMGGQHLNAPVTSIGATSDGGGYWEFAADGGVFAFGDAPFAGSATGTSTPPVAAGTSA